MKRFILSVCLSAFFISAYSQSTNDSTVNAMLSRISGQLDFIEFRIRGLDRFKLYQTDNIYTLLKLDTQTGRVDQLQWSLDSDKEGTWTINGEDLSENTGCGTFELYPTKNMYQFILLDKVHGRQWHIQWGMEYEKRWIRRIY